jgi:hypothetical protein
MAGIVASLLLFLGLSTLSAQEHSLRVVVKDATGAPVPKAHVALLRHQDAKPPKAGESDRPTVDSMAETDNQGVVVLNVSNGVRYRVEVRASGFIPWNLSDFRPKKPVLDVVLEVGFIVIY